METVSFSSKLALSKLRLEVCSSSDTDASCDSFENEEEEENKNKNLQNKLTLPKKPNHVFSCSCPACRKYQKLRLKTQKVLRVNNSGIKVVNNIFASHGFSLQTKLNSNLNMIWLSASVAVKRRIYTSVQKHQKINSFPASSAITRKDELYRNFLKMKELFGAKEFNYLPKSYILPQDREQYTKDFFHSKTLGNKSPNEENLWIVKPVNRACGKGIKIYKGLHNIDLELHYQPPYSSRSYESVIISKYISSPLLLSGRKFDLRIYVLITSFDPLRIYMYNDGLVRLATESFSTNEKLLTNDFVHLTNSFIQKKHRLYKKNNLHPQEIPKADVMPSKLSFKQFKHFAEVHKLGINFNEVFVDIEDIVIKTILSMETKARTSWNKLRSKGLEKKSNFQLYGFDLLLEASNPAKLHSRTKVWLIEVNGSPSLGISSTLDKVLKTEMLCELLNVVGVQKIDNEQQRIEAMTSKSAGDVKKNVTMNCRRPEFVVECDNNTESARERDNKINAIKRKKVKREIQAEQKLTKNWKLLFPTTQSEKFHNFFEEITPKQQLVFEAYRDNDLVK